MKTVDVIRAWKDRSYRNSLSAEQLASLPHNPVGAISDVEAEMISGGNDTWSSNATAKTGRSGCDECEMP